MTTSTTLPPNDCDRTVSAPSASSLAVSLASLIALLVGDEQAVTNATSGPSLPESLAKYDPSGSWVRTSGGYAVLSLDGSTVEYLETWPGWGIALDGRAYALPMLALPTDANGYSSSRVWPTPGAQDGSNRASLTANRSEVNPKVTLGVTLVDAVRLWPTPQARDGDQRGVQSQEIRRAQGHGITLPETMRDVQNWHTPQASDGTGSRKRSMAVSPTGRAPDGSKKSVSLGMDVRASSGALNPAWVTQLMGFPDGWLDVSPGKAKRSANGKRRGP